MNNLQDLYMEQLRDIYNAETQLVNALPKMATAATSNDLKQAFEHHLNETRQHVQRLEQVFSNMGVTPHGETCQAMQGLIKEGEEVIQKQAQADVKDAALIAAAQRIEHYEIAAYGTVCTFAEQLSHDAGLGLLRKTLKEEKAADSKLTDLAEGSINQNAQGGTRRRTAERIGHMGTVVALYPDFPRARGAIEELVAAGFDRSLLSLVASDQDNRYASYIRDMGMERQEQHDADAGEGAGFGAVVGTLAGLGVALIPGLGGFVVAGAAGAALFAGLGAAAGAATGGLAAGLMDVGIDESDATAYAEGVRGGGILVIAHVDNQWREKVASIMRKHSPVDIERVHNQ